MVERKYIPHWCKVNAVHQIELLPLGVSGSYPLCLLAPTLTFACACSCLCSCLYLLTLTIALCTYLCPSCLLAAFIPAYALSSSFVHFTFYVNILINLHIVINILIFFWEDIIPFCGATYTPVLNFWWYLLWVLKPEWAAIFMLAGAYVLYIPSDSPLLWHLLTSWWPA